MQKPAETTLIEAAPLESRMLVVKSRKLIRYIQSQWRDGENSALYQPALFVQFGVNHKQG